MNPLASLLPAIALALVVACSDPAPVLRQPVAQYSAANPLAAQLLRDVNGYRARHGAAPLQTHPDLARLALQHSEYLRRNRGRFSVYGKNVSHFGSEARVFTAIEILRMSDYSENVAATHNYGSAAKTSRALVILWQRSRGHEVVMRKASWTHTGIGIVTDADGTVFATQAFGVVKPARVATRTTSPRF